jgi:agmatine deiminase
MTCNNETPSALGYHMPAEWEAHQATWLSWPRPDGISFPGCYDRVIPTFVKMVEALAHSEKVYLNVSGGEEENRVSKLLPPAVRSQVHYFHQRTNEPWCRDHGPIFLVDRKLRQLAVCDWDYNAWGAKYSPYDDDDRVPERIASQLGVKRFCPSMILEGGSIDVNGSGTLLTTESCLLNPNRNSGWTKIQIEEKLKSYLGVSHILWLGDGIEGDDTDGHVDDLSRFVNRTTVVTVIEEDKSDENFTPLNNNFQRLKTMRVEDGTPIEVLTLPMPRKIIREDVRLPASYANFYIANKIVLLPIYQDPADAEAIAVLTSLFPDREIVAVDCRELIWGLGAFHCLTQQQPSA